MSETHPALLRVEGLACRRGGRSLFQGLTFALAPGGLITLTGPNGSGKSSLLRILAGFSQADEGVVHFFAKRDDALELHYYGHRDGMREALTARENLDFTTRLLGGDPGSVAESLGRMGAARLADLPLRILSAGQRRRVALARLLTVPRPLWLLDEPLTALDASGQGLVSALIAAHVAGGGGAIIATHQPLDLAGETIQLGGAA